MYKNIIISIFSFYFLIVSSPIFAWNTEKGQFRPRQYHSMQPQYNHHPDNTRYGQNYINNNHNNNNDYNQYNHSNNRYNNQNNSHHENENNNGYTNFNSGSQYQSGTIVY